MGLLWCHLVQLEGQLLHKGQYGEDGRLLQVGLEVGHFYTQQLLGRGMLRLEIWTLSVNLKRNMNDRSLSILEMEQSNYNLIIYGGISIYTPKKCDNGGSFFP